MICAWKELLAILPQHIRKEVDYLSRDSLQELRLRCNAPPELIINGKSIFLKENAHQDDLSFIINAASRYSPWTASTISQGYLTAPGGHRIGICGDAVNKDGNLYAIQRISSLCIRIARDFPGIAPDMTGSNNSILILGAPGWGKTTLLRDLARILSEHEVVSVVDERGELFPNGIPRGKRMDVLSGSAKAVGITMLLRTMRPQYIAVDEITAEEDCQAILDSANCGVHLLATAHASSREDFYRRRIYQSLTANHVFQTLLILHRDKSYTVERISA